MVTKYHLHRMAPSLGKLAVIAVVALHSVLIAAYTLPNVLVPEQLRVIGQWYARPLFHQQWKLFAPDPPLCSCALEWRQGDAVWRPVATAGMHYLELRMVQNHCLWLAEGLPGAEGAALPALLRLTRTCASSAPRFRLVEECVTDASRPSERRTHLIPLFGP